MEKTFQDRIAKKAFVRILPLLIFAYLAAYLDRVNIANAALTMNADIGLTTNMFGLGSGLFFITYFIFGPPSNLLLEKIGARLWIAPMIVCLGLLSMAMAFVTGPLSFLTVRLLLGIAEAGFFPGVILYLTYWFPTSYRSRITAAFMTAIPASLALGGPISNAILHLSGLWGFKGWQWLFLLEGFVSVLLAFIMFAILPDRPEHVLWLNTQEKSWLLGELKKEAQVIRGVQKIGIARAFSDPRVLILAYNYLANTTTNLGIAYFLPLIVKSMGATVRQANYISAIPYVAGVVGILLFGILSDRFKQNRQFILICTLIISGVGLAGAGLINASVWTTGLFGAGPLAISYASIVLVALAAIGIYGTKAPFWPLPSMFLTGSAAAAGIGVINSIGNLGGFVGPYMVGWVKDTTHSYATALYFLAGIAFSAVLAALFVKSPAPASNNPIHISVATQAEP